MSLFLLNSVVASVNARATLAFSKIFLSSNLSLLSCGLLKFASALIPPLCTMMSCGLVLKKICGFFNSSGVRTDKVKSVLYEAYLCNTFGCADRGSCLMLSFRLYCAFVYAFHFSFGFTFLKKLFDARPSLLDIL